jgi:hypothetical protein
MVHVWGGRCLDEARRSYVSTDEEPAEALAWDEPPQRVGLVMTHEPTPRIVDCLEHRPDFRLVSRYDFEHPDIQLMLFERTPSAERDDG